MNEVKRLRTAGFSYTLKASNVAQKGEPYETAHRSFFRFASSRLRCKCSSCSGLMKPDTLLGENARQIEVSDDQTTPFLYS